MNKQRVHNLVEAKAIIKEWNARGFADYDIVKFETHDGAYLCTFIFNAKTYQYEMETK